MNQKLNKSSILVALENDRKIEQKEENKKIYLIKERIKREQLALINKDKELRQISEELQKQITSQRRQLSQPMNFNQITFHQQNYDSLKIIKDQERQNKKLSVPILDFQKSNTYIQLLHEKKEEQKKLIEKRKEIKAKKYAQIKYSEIVKEIYFRPLTKSIHEEKVDTEGIQIKSKPISLHEKSMHSNSVETYDSIKIDKYLVNKLEKILQVNETQPDNYKTEKRKKIKINKLNNTSQKLSPIPKEKIKIKENSEGIHMHKKYQEVQSNQWKNIFDDSQISQSDKVIKTLDQIQLLKNKAEKLEVETTSKINIEKEEKLNDLLINQIQARLALLEQFNQ